MKDREDSKATFPMAYQLKRWITSGNISIPLPHRPVSTDNLEVKNAAVNVVCPSSKRYRQVIDCLSIVRYFN